jgi:poly(beta-D-mannuronate) lyase
MENVVVGSTGLDLELGSDFKKHWPESQQVLLPEDCRIEGNRFVRPHGGVSVLITPQDSKPPLDRFAFKPNHAAGNVVIGAMAAREGFASEEPAAGPADSPERLGLKPLTAREVGPAWVVARRDAGNFAMEDAPSAPRSVSLETPKRKKGN